MAATKIPKPALKEIQLQTSDLIGIIDGITEKRAKEVERILRRFDQRENGET